MVWTTEERTRSYFGSVTLSPKNNPLRGLLFGKFENHQWRGPLDDAHTGSLVHLLQERSVGIFPDTGEKITVFDDGEGYFSKRTIPFTTPLQSREAVVHLSFEGRKLGLEYDLNLALVGVGTIINDPTTINIALHFCSPVPDTDPLCAIIARPITQAIRSYARNIPLPQYEQ